MIPNPLFKLENGIIPHGEVEQISADRQDPDKKKARMKIYRATNREKRREDLKTWRRSNPDKVKIQKHKDFIKDYAKNKDRIKLYQTQWSLENKEHLKEYIKDWSNQTRYGISLLEKIALIQMQNNKCACCLEDFDPKREPHTDHDHSTLEIRGIVCRRCNLTLGYFGDTLEGTIKYGWSLGVEYLTNTVQFTLLRLAIIRASQGNIV